MRPCGPVTDEDAAARVREDLAPIRTGAAVQDEALWAALAPVFSASPYLASLARRWPAMLMQVLDDAPQARLEVILDETLALQGGASEVASPLRLLKAQLHLLTALCDLGGVWSLGEVTGALSRFADEAVRTSLMAVATDAHERGRLLRAPERDNPVPGVFGLAMGKHGALELNYSSDIDVSLFFEPETLVEVISERQDAQTFANRVAQGLSAILSERTSEGYVFRFDLRLRPDPSSTPPVVAAPHALTYYESVGQNWERAAFIKARPVCGDIPAAEAFLKALRPFVWRRSLDFPAIADIHSIKRQIHVHKVDEGLAAAGANLKLGRGGIREIEFFAQTQQLILGGRDARLRARATCDALDALVIAGHLAADSAEVLKDAYARLRHLEHRVQMLADEQTHSLPHDDARRAAVAALAGEEDLAAFDARVEALLKQVNAIYGELFAEDEPLSSSFGSLVFTGVENDPATIETLSRMGFDDPETVCSTIRSWHHGRIPATRTARGRELFTRLAPRMLDACARSGAPNAAFTRFAVFFSGLSAGVQVQSLFLARNELFERVIELMAMAPRLARFLSRNPSALDSVLDARFYMALEIDSGVSAEIVAEAAAASDFEDAMNRVRRIQHEQMLRVGIQVLGGHAATITAGHAYSDLADACVRALAPVAMNETLRQAGAFEGRVAVIALGKAGSREMTAASDLDLMTLYAAEPDAMSAVRGWGADMVYGRFTQRLISALSSQTAEGRLYEVDMRLRPTGSAGPVAVSLGALSDYYAREAQTWEFMALTRARVVWASDRAFEQEAASAIEAALRKGGEGRDLAGDVAQMRALMERERPAKGFWDYKHARGGQVDVEFAAQFLTLRDAAAGGAVVTGTMEALATHGADPALANAWHLQQSAAQLMGAAFENRRDPDDEISAFRQRLADVAGQPDFEALKSAIEAARRQARGELKQLLGRAGDGLASL